MRIPIRTSRSATWARRLGGFALPLLIVPIILNRGGNISSDAFVLVEVAGLLLALLAVVLGSFAAIRLWFSGDRGWDRAIGGILLGVVCLAYPAYFAATNLKYGTSANVATSIDADIVLPDVPGVADSPQSLPDLGLRFPNMVTRRYDLATQDVVGLVRQIIAERGWQTIAENPAADVNQEWQMTGEAMTPTGFRDKVGIRVAERDDRVLVDMRSATISGTYDFGANGHRIEAFLKELDEAVTNFVRDQASPQPDAPLPADPAPAIRLPLKR